MGKSIGQLAGGIIMILLGVLLSAASGQRLFIGLLIFGLVFMIVGIVNLSKGRKSVSDGVEIKRMDPTDKPQEREAFLKNLDDQADLAAPKEVVVTCSRKDQRCMVNLNGEDVGILSVDAPLIMNVTKQNNVVSISNEYEGICFFHVKDLEGAGQLKVSMGISSNALKVVPGNGIGEGLATGSLPAAGAAAAGSAAAGTTAADAVTKTSAAGAAAADAVTKTPEAGAAAATSARDILEQQQAAKKKKKMVIMIVIIVVAVIAALVAASLIQQHMALKAWQKNQAALGTCMENCDVDGSRHYAEELDSGIDEGRVDVLEEFLAYHDAGEWQKAIDAWEGNKGDQYTANLTSITKGKAFATYMDCLYEASYKKPIDKAMAKKDYKAALSPVEEFGDELKWCRLQSEYGKYFPENGKDYFDAVEETGKYVFKNGDYGDISAFLKYVNWDETDANFGSYSWVQQAEEWVQDNHII